MKDTWYKLDNAAKIYPAFASKKDPATFRIAVVLKKEIKYKVLQKALNQTIEAFPSMAVTLRQGLFWYYLDDNIRKPLVLAETKMPCTYINLKKNNGYLFNVFYHDKRISLECFHALTDGYGGLEFLKALLYNYLKQLYPVNSQELRLSGLLESDVEDSYIKYATDERFVTESTLVKHIKGTPTHIEGALVHHGIINAALFNQVAKKYSTTITVLLTAIYMKSLYAELKEGPLVIAVPVNLRKIFPSTTLRNFSYVINVCIKEDMSIEKMIESISNQFKSGLKKEHLQGQFSKNVDFENKMALKLTPNFLKSIFLKRVRTLKSKRVVTTILSNPGIVTIPDNMVHFVDRFECVLYASNPHTMNIGICTYNNKMTISISRNIKEKVIVDNFFNLLKEISSLDIIKYTNEGE